MSDDKLGPNGGILYALEELEHNIDWLEKGLKDLGEDYVLFDCPGQVELYTHHNSLRNIFFKIQKLGYRVSAALTPIVGFLAADEPRSLSLSISPTHCASHSLPSIYRICSFASGRCFRWTCLISTS
jgi:hypothetical protein